jgi:glycosyltransferase involved in cell wall biosynthesis
VQAYYRDRFGSEPPCIAYGSEVEALPPGETLRRFGLERGRYVLFVGRLVPENCAHHLVTAFRQISSDMKCVIVGDAPYAEAYNAELRVLAQSDPRILFTGYVFGRGYQELGSNAALFVETSGVGGTHPALVEAMAFGNAVVVNDTAENLETIAGAGVAYNGRIGAESLRTVLIELLNDPARIEQLRAAARQRARAVYSWEAITDEYERLFYRVCRQPAPERLR